MSAGFHARKWSRQEADDLPAPRRISTPAGMRLSVIMKDIETGQPAPVSPVSPKIGNRPPQLTFNKETTTVRVVEEEDEDAESIQKESQSAKTSSTPRAYATSLFSVDSEPAAHVVEEKQKDPKKAPLIAMSIAGRRKCIIFSVVAFLMAFSLIVGLAVGFSHKKSRYVKFGSSNILLTCSQHENGIRYYNLTFDCRCSIASFVRYPLYPCYIAERFPTRHILSLYVPRHSHDDLHIQSSNMELRPRHNLQRQRCRFTSNIPIQDLWLSWILHRRTLGYQR